MRTNSSIDANLVKQFQLGNTKALTELVKRWHKPFCQKAYWIVRDADISKDIAQESWKTIIAKIHNLKDPSKFRSWALRIVYSKSIDVMRESNTKRLQLEAFAITENQKADEAQEDDPVKKELLKGIISLPVSQQQVIRLFYVEDYSLKEISKILQISVGTVKSRLFYAREQLKIVLKKVL